MSFAAQALAHFSTACSTSLALLSALGVLGAAGAGAGAGATVTAATEGVAGALAVATLGMLDAAATGAGAGAGAGAAAGEGAGVATGAGLLVLDGLPLGANMSRMNASLGGTAVLPPSSCSALL